MLIDIIFILVLIMAIFNGLSKGFVLGIFSFLALIIGLAAALKLSVVVARYLEHSVVAATKWLPLISFILVLILVMIIVGLLARLIKKTLQFALLGWLDSLGGMILYIVLYTIVFSIFLFYAEKLRLLNPDVIANSKTYPYIASWGIKVMDNIGKIIPIFKDMFAELEAFFSALAKKAA
jgi:membrane protein required for colicin V production